jgi:hypothetical protein
MYLRKNGSVAPCTPKFVSVHIDPSSHPRQSEMFGVRWPATATRECSSGGRLGRNSIGSGNVGRCREIWREKPRNCRSERSASRVNSKRSTFRDIVNTTCEVMSRRVGARRLQTLQAQASAGAKQPVTGRSLSKIVSTYDASRETPADTRNPIMSET